MKNKLKMRYKKNKTKKVDNCVIDRQIDQIFLGNGRDRQVMYIFNCIQPYITNTLQQFFLKPPFWVLK